MQEVQKVFDLVAVGEGCLQIDLVVTKDDKETIPLLEKCKMQLGELNLLMPGDDWELVYALAADSKA